MNTRPKVLKIEKILMPAQHQALKLALLPAVLRLTYPFQCCLRLVTYTALEADASLETDFTILSASAVLASAGIEPQKKRSPAPEPSIWPKLLENMMPEPWSETNVKYLQRLSMRTLLPSLGDRH